MHVVMSTVVDTQLLLWLPLYHLYLTFKCGMRLLSASSLYSASSHCLHHSAQMNIEKENPHVYGMTKEIAVIVFASLFVLLSQSSLKYTWSH